MKRAGKERPPPPPVSLERLDRAALRYLERYAASASSLRRVLLARVERSCREEEGREGEVPFVNPAARAEGRVNRAARAECRAWVEELIERYLRTGLLNDASYAEAKAASLRRHGASSRAIRSHLASRGVDEETTATALGRIDRDRDARDRDASDRDASDGEEGGDSANLAAAKILARRRRLGPFRDLGQAAADQRAKLRARDLAALGRAGFDYETARRVIDGEP